MESLPLMLNRYFEGETQAGFAIFERFEANIARYLQRRGEGDHVGDLTSAIRLTFLEKLPHLRDRRQVKEFLFQITRDELAKHWLRGRRYVELESGGDEIGTESPDHFLKIERLRVLRDCLDAIPDQKVRQVAARRYRLGERQKEISAEMRLTIDQVKKYARKRAELKAVVKNPASSDEDRWQAQLKLQSLPRNANPVRQQRRCQLASSLASPRKTIACGGDNHSCKALIIALCACGYFCIPS